MLILYCFSSFVSPKLSRSHLFQETQWPIYLSGLSRVQSWSHQVHTPKQIPPAVGYSSSRKTKKKLQKSLLIFWQWCLELERKLQEAVSTGRRPVRDHIPGVVLLTPIVGQGVREEPAEVKEMVHISSLHFNKKKKTFSMWICRDNTDKRTVWHTGDWPKKTKNLACQQ